MSKFTAVVIEQPTADLRVVVRKVKVDGDSTKWLNQQVGGYFEHIYSEDRKTDFWVHDEGKLIGLPVNVVATEVLYDLHPVFRGQDVLVGTVVLTGNRGPNTGNVPVATWAGMRKMQFLAAERAGLTVEFVDETVAANA